MRKTVVQLRAVVQEEVHAQALIRVLAKFEIGVYVAAGLVEGWLLRVPPADMARRRHAGEGRGPMAAIGTLAGWRRGAGLIVGRLWFLDLGNAVVVGALIGHLHVLLRARIGGVVGR